MKEHKNLFNSFNRKIEKIDSILGRESNIYIFSSQEGDGAEKLVYQENNNSGLLFFNPYDTTGLTFRKKYIKKNDYLSTKQLLNSLEKKYQMRYCDIEGANYDAFIYKEKGEIVNMFVSEGLSLEEKDNKISQHQNYIDIIRIISKHFPDRRFLHLN